MIELQPGETRELNVALTREPIAALQGHVDLQGRPPDGISWVTPLVLTMIQDGIVVGTSHVSTDTGGTFRIAVPAGHFDLCVKSPRALSQRVNDVELAGYNNPVEFGTLREGDVDNNDVIDINDSELLADAQGSVPGDANWDDRCDFNRNGAVDLQDYALMYTNFGQVGECGSPPALVGDVNGDGHVNQLDLDLIAAHMGETGAPGWIPEDVNKDGVIDVLDLILAGQNWTG